MSEVYRLENFTKKYDDKEILNIKNWGIEEGAITGLMGANGSGKSTILRHLAFLEYSTSGKIFYKNQPNIQYDNPIKREISILFPEPYLLRRNIKENLIYGLKAYKIKCDFDKEAKEMLALVGLNEKFLTRYSHTLSSGEKQRVALAARLITKPKTMLLDEPTSSLDDVGVPQFSKAIRDANEMYKTTFVIVSHDKKWLKSISSHDFSLIDGGIYKYDNFLKGTFEEKDNFLLFHTDENRKIKLSKPKDFNKNLGLALNPRKISLCDIKSASSNSIIGEIISTSKLQKSDEVSIIFKTATQTIECIYPKQNFLKNNFHLTQKVALVL